MQRRLVLSKKYAVFLSYANRISYLSKPFLDKNEIMPIFDDRKIIQAIILCKIIWRRLNFPEAKLSIIFENSALKKYHNKKTYLGSLRKQFLSFCTRYWEKFEVYDTKGIQLCA